MIEMPTQLLLSGR